MSSYPYIIEKDLATGFYVGYVPNMKGAHSMGKTLKELHENMKDVIELLKEGDDIMECNTEFIKVEKVLI